MYEQCSENPKKAIQSVENVENEKQCGKNPEDTNLGVNVLFRRRGIMQSKSQQSVEVGPIPAAAEECSDIEEGLMEEEDTVCKIPLLKRKQARETCGSKAKKSAASGGQGEETE